MDRKHNWKKDIVLLLMTMMGLIWFHPVQVTAAEHEDITLKVGYIDYHGFIAQNSDGEYTGYAVEYLNKISEYTGFQYEYVYGTWPELMEELKNGEIDLLCNAQYTEERAKNYDYTQLPLGYTQGLLYTLPDNQQLEFEDFDKFNGLTVGAVKASATTPLFHQYSEKHGFSCQIVDYDSEAEMMEALEKGEIDAMLSENMASLTGYTLLAEYSAGPYYIISYKGSPYMEKLNTALQEIKTSMDFEQELYQKYYGNTAASEALRLTAEERDYIAEGNVIRVGLMQERPPFSSYDVSTGEFTGICYDVLESIAKETGLKFSYQPMDIAKTTPELFETGKYDVICGIERDNFVTNETLVPTTAFMNSAVVPVGRKGSNVDMTGPLKVAVSTSFQALIKRLSSDYPNMEIVGYDTSEECLNQVAAGHADLFIQNTYLLGQLLQRPKYDELEVLPVEIMEEHTAMVMRRDSDPVLLSIFNKSIEALDDTMLSASLIEHTFATQYHYTAIDYLTKLWMPIMMIAFLVTVCFILITRVAVVRKHSEIALQKKNALLSDAVAQAEQANAAKGQFLSRMSHEIRTPMNAIVGLTTIARQHKKEPEKVEDYLSKIDTSSKVLLNIINDVLDMSAIEGNKLKVANEEFDIKHVLTGISTIYYPQCESKGIIFDFKVDIEDEILIGDSLRLNQILLNLVSNAYKFTEKGGTITVSVTEDARRENTAFLCIQVADTGCGMSEEMIQRLFKPFEQESASTAQLHGGSGLGLSIAKNLVDLMHGAIKVESEKGKGTTFTVDIPFEVAANQVNEESQSLSSIRILVVDDDPSALEYASIVLKRLGVMYDSAKSGEEALRMIDEADKNQTPYDVCLADWKMAGMDGVELTRHIREKEQDKTMIIIVSAYDLNEVTDQAKTAGADHFVSKPLFQSTLYDALMPLTNGAIQTRKPAKDSYDFTGHRVLLAEDQVLNAEIATELLNMVHLEVDHAENGRRALEMFSEADPDTYDLILMDVQMPEMDGYAAARAIRALERPDASVIPIYAMTANAFTEDVSTALSAGMNGHIAKPIDTDILYATIDQVISKEGEIAQ
ncbi:MAG: transporter substrate-binding domain-containing protein [bacterium]|nr:transporter substrate-binding domain-containing protein [bacterium]